MKKIYVTPNGKGDGSKRNPASLGDAILNAHPDDVLLIQGGRYEAQAIFDATTVPKNMGVVAEAFEALNGKMEA